MLTTGLKVPYQHPKPKVRSHQHINTHLVYVAIRICYCEVILQGLSPPYMDRIKGVQEKDL